MSESSDSEVEAAFARPIVVPNQSQRNGRSINLINQPGPSRIVPGPPENAGIERERSSAESPARASTSTDQRKKKRRPPRIRGSRNNVYGKYYPLSSWMAQKIPQKRYFPQTFDTVIYLRQAHEIYLSVVKRKYPEYYKPILKPPWELFDLAAEELCHVTSVEFVLCPARMCRLQLHLKKTNDRFWICYHPVLEALDFMVLIDIFDYGPKEDWQVGDRFRCIASNNTWRLGTVTSMSPLESRFPESHFLRYEVRWDDGTDGRLSFWDLETVHLEGLIDEKGEEIPLDDLAWIGVNRSPDLPLGDHRVYKNIFLKLHEVLQRSFCEPFVNAIHEREDPMYLKVIAYPVDFYLIMTRYGNGFYRRIAGLLTDIDYMQRNALLYYPRNHDCARIARFCHGLLTRIVSNYDRNVHMCIMFDDSVIEQAEDELESDEDRRERSKNRYRPNNESRPPLLQTIPSNQVPLMRYTDNLERNLYNEYQLPILQEIPINEAPEDLRRVPHHVQPGLRPDENRPPILRQIPNNEVPQNEERDPQHLLPNVRQVPAVYDPRSRSFLSFLPPLINNYKQKLVASRQCDNSELDTSYDHNEFLSSLHASARHNFNTYHNLFTARRNQPSINDRWRHIRNPPLVFLTTGTPLNQRLVSVLSQPLVLGQVKNRSSTSENQYRNRSLPLDLSTHDNRSLMNEIQECKSNSLVLKIDQNQPSTSQSQGYTNYSQSLFEIYQNQPSTSQSSVNNLSSVLERDLHYKLMSLHQMRVSCSQSLFEIYQNQPPTSQSSVNNVSSVLERDLNYQLTCLRQMRESCSQSLFEIYQNPPPTCQSSVNNLSSFLERDLNQLSSSLLQKRVSSPTSVFDTDQIQSPTNEPQKCPDSPPLDLTTERKQPPKSQGKKRIGNPSSLGLNINQPSASYRCQKPLNNPSLDLNIDYDQTSTEEPLALTSQHRRKQKRASSKHHQQPIESSSSLSDSSESSASESNESKRKRERARINKILIKANVWRLDCMEMVQNLLNDINDAMFSEPAMYSYRRGAFEWHNLETVMYELNAALFEDPYALLTAVHDIFIEGRSLNVTGDEEVSAIINRLSLNFNRGIEPIINRWGALNNAEKE